MSPHLRFTLCLLFAWTQFADASLRAQNPLAKPAVTALAFAGEFEGTNIALQLTFDGAKQEYSGTLTFQGQRYACAANEKDGQLAGKFVVQGEGYAFTASRAANKITLVSDGNTYELTAKDAARNPLAKERDVGQSAQPGQPTTNQPVASNSALPAWLKTGARVTFYAGSATLPGVSSTLVEDDQGNWVDGNGNCRVGKIHQLESLGG